MPLPSTARHYRWGFTGKALPSMARHYGCLFRCQLRGLRRSYIRGRFMPAAVPVYMPWLMTAGFGWLYYRRIRRHFGWQPWRPVRNAVRIGVLSLVGAALVAAAIYIPHVALGIIVGAIAGVGLGLFALRHTLISSRDGRVGYTPNPWIGGALAVLLMGRLAWRWYGGAFSQGMGAGMGNASPLTLALAAALISYGFVQAIGLAIRLRS